METEEVLHKLEEMGLLELIRITGDYYQIRCPFHEDKKPSCGVLLHDVVRNGKTYPAGFTHCFRGDTEVITRNGIKPIAELCDKFGIQIINGKGEWETTVFHKYGNAQIWQILIRKNITTVKPICTTQNHEWFIHTPDGTCLHTTDRLQNGMLLEPCYLNGTEPEEVTYWEVISVLPTTEFAPVYCCRTSTESFVLEGNILTHNCFSCGWAKSLPDTVTRILKERNISSQSGLEWLKENIPGFTGEVGNFDYLISRSELPEFLKKFSYDYQNFRIIQESNPNLVSEEELASYRLTVPYMYERGLTDDIIAKYDIGFDANFLPPGRKKPVPCVTFPVKNLKGETLFLCRRSIQGKMFHYPQGVEKSVYGIYELPDNPKSVIICESCFNALTCVKYGYNAVALLGTGTSYEIKQLRMLGVREFVICTDGDEAGQRASAKLKKALSDVAIVWTVHMPPDKDVNDCKTKEEFDLYYNNKD